MMTPIETTAVAETAKTANGILNKLLGPAVEEWGAIISENLKPRRLKNQIRNLRKVQKIIEDEGLKLKEVNLKVLFPYLENVSLEEDETLQNMWANLFVNYIDSAKTLVVTVYPNILAQLSSDEVKILEIFQQKNGKLEIKMDGDPITLISEPVTNLIRLGIVGEIAAFSQYPSHAEDNRPQWLIEKVQSEDFYLTDFGINFLNACNRS